MACSNLNEKANGSRLSRLLVDKGTEAMRNTFDNIHPPSTLAAVLKAKVKQLQKLRYKVINDPQWNALYPKSGKPNSTYFDVTLLMILLRNICGLPKPASGWGSMPPDPDRSVEANILRIKLFRNEVYAHVTVTEVDDALFENLWQKISKALLDLGIPQQEIDQLKICSLSPEEETYVEQLKAWKRAEDEWKEIIDEIKSSTTECKDILHDVKGTLQNTQQICQQSQRSTADVLKDSENIKALLAKLSQESSLKQRGDEEILLKLAKHNFNGNIRSLVKSFHQGSREWLFKRLEDWFAEEESRVMILTAGPGVGKSVFAGKVCEVYKKKGKLAACHFCKFNDSNLSNPQRMLESLAIHMCANVKGFEDKLVEQLKRPHEVRGLEDTFRIYLNEPLQNLETEEPMLIIIDGLDESEIDGKSELLELIAEEFSKLPEWIKFLITSRPEIPVKKKLRHLNPFEILQEDENNRADLQRYFDTHLPKLSSNENINQLLVKKCQGSFLFAFYVQSELNELSRMQDISVEVIERFLPQGIGSVYQKYFRRLESELKILNSQLDFRQFLEILVSARGPLPLSFLSALLANGPPSIKQALRKVNESLSSLLVVCEDLVTVFHKSVVDWLTGNGYEEHEYAVDGKAGAKYLWQACEKEYEEIKERYPGVNLTNAMKYALDRGFSHLVGDNVACSVPTDCLWLVDPCIVHVITAVHPKTVDSLHASWKKCLEQSFCTNIQRKILWHSLLLSEFVNREVFPEYLQNLINDFPSEITSEGERSEAKRLLNESIWCEKLNSVREEHCTHFLSMTVLESNISCISISPNKKYCAAGREDGMITFLEFPSLEVIGSCPTGLKSAVPCCTFSPDNSIVLYGQLHCGVNVKTQEKSCFFNRCNHHFSGCSFSPSGTRLVTADGSETLRLWDIKTQSLLGLFGAGSPMDSCTYSQSGSFVIGEEKIACGEPRFAKCNAYPVQIVGIWDTFTLQRVDRRHPTGSRPNRSSLSDGFNISKMYTLGTEVVLSSIISFSRIPFEVYALPVCAPICDGNRFLVDSYSVIKSKPSTSLLRCEHKSWDVVDYYSQNVLACRLSSPIDYLLPSNLVLAVACDEAFLLQRESQLLAVETPSEQPKSQVCVVTCCFSPDGSRLASFTDDKMLSIWDVHKSRAIKKFRLFSKAVACWWSEKYFWRFHIANGKPLLTRFPVSPQLKIEASVYKDFPVYCKVLSFHTFTEGMLVLGCKDGTICVLNVVTGRSFRATTKRPVTCAAASPDGSFILLAGYEGYEVWKAESTSNHRDWSSVRVGNLSDGGHTSTCITSNSKLGLIVTNMFAEQDDFDLHVLDLQSGVIRRFSISTEISYFSRNIWLTSTRICTTSSYLVITDGKHSKVNILDIDGGKLVGRLVNPVGSKYYFRSGIVFHRKENLLAVPNDCGCIDFIRIHVPQ